MTFSVNKLWEKCGLPVPELSITLPAPVYGKRELFLSFPGEFETVRFLVIPHCLPDRTITVHGMRSPQPCSRREVLESRRLPLRRHFVRPNNCVAQCRLRL